MKKRPNVTTFASALSVAVMSCALVAPNANAALTDFEAIQSSNSNLVFQYAFEGGDDPSRLADGSGNGYTLQRIAGSGGGSVNDIQFVNGFDGASQAYQPAYDANRTVGAGLNTISSSVPLSSNLTLEAVVQLDNFVAPTNATAVYMFAGRPSGKERAYALRQKEDTGVDYMTTTFGDNNNDQPNVLAYTAGHWYYIALTASYDSGTSNTTVSWYGADLSASQTTIQFYGTDNTTFAGDWTGNSQIGIGNFLNGAQEYMEGRLDNIALTGGILVSNDFQARLNALYIPAPTCQTATILTDPDDQTVEAPATATFSVTALGTSRTYQWQVSTNSGSTWSNVTTGSGGTNSSYTTAATTVDDSGNQYRCIVNVACDSSSATSAVATLTVNEAIHVALVADADTCIRENNPSSSRATAVLEVRSRDVSGSGRQNVAYMRFDLTVLADTPGTNAVFSVTRSTSNSGSSFTEGQVHVYGLLDTLGNTPQLWAESLTYNSSGAEVPGDGNPETQDLDTNRLQFIGDLPASVAPGTSETLSISNAVLDAFIADRFANGGALTLMLVEENAADRELYFEQREVGNFPPTLTVVGQLGGTGVDTNPPTVTLVSPSNGAVNVDVSGQVTAQFSEPMDTATISSNTFILYDAESNSVPATVSYNAGSLTAILAPHVWLGPNSTYTAVVLGGPSGVTDVASNALTADFSWSFTTGETPALSPYVRNSLAPDADTYLTNDENKGPTVNNGGQSAVEVRWLDVRVHIGYVRYDITAVPASVYSHATLQGTFTDSRYNGPGTWQVYGLNDDAPGNYWDEGTVTYATAAGLDPSAPTNTFAITSDATLLGTITLDGSDVQPLPFSSATTNLDLTSFLQADTDGKVTFIIVSSTNNGTEYRIDSKEGNSTGGHGPMRLTFAPLFVITDAKAAAGPSLILQWADLGNHSYRVERNLDLGMASGWVPLASNVVMNTYTDAAPATAQAFYRVVDEGEIPPSEYFFDDFEGPDNWTVLTGSNHMAGTDWQRGMPTSGPMSTTSGTNVWATNLGGDYGPNADTSILSPTIDLSSATTANLQFSNYFDTEAGYDFCYVYVRDSSGAPIAGLENPIATYDDYLTDWRQDTVALPAGALGQTIRIEFRFTSDGDVFYPGWYIDDVRVTE